MVPKVLPSRTVQTTSTDEEARQSYTNACMHTLEEDDERTDSFGQWVGMLRAVVHTVDEMSGLVSSKACPVSQVDGRGRREENADW